MAGEKPNSGFPDAFVYPRLIVGTRYIVVPDSETRLKFIQEEIQSFSSAGSNYYLIIQSIPLEMPVF